MSKPKIGFIGLGIMGRPMSKHLINAGYELTVYDIVADSVKEIAAAGATAASTCKEVAENSDVIITMVPDSPDVEAAVFGENGIAEGIKSGSYYVDMSTIAPSVAISVGERLAEQGVKCLDGPVSGGDVGAQNAALSIMCGGEEDVFNEIKPIFDIMGKAVLCGKLGSGQIVKACNQVLVAVTIAGVSEALTLGAKAGVDPLKIVEVLSGGLARCGILENRGERMVNGDFDPGFRIRLHYKDLNIIQKTGNDFGVPLPVTGSVFELFKTAMVQDRGELDHSGLLTVIEDMAGIQARTGE
ncbi:MAG: 2-hydroxy-3-oxopropionate reductase [Candidatus Latescibacteria bacterium]|jgi:2-hydroxy-3-oxopropionate reductase|nr:2-hydroxy-3-oxopropionate reductase [Candidatus Latescibacterota bacterium]MBT4139227.1 2-hydroxy-3-oxopropionate reductase [Candidatus Latescibacterota bacterium]